MQDRVTCFKLNWYNCAIKIKIYIDHTLKKPYYI